MYGSACFYEWFECTECIGSATPIVCGVYCLSYSKATQSPVSCLFVKIRIIFYSAVDIRFKNVQDGAMVLILFQSCIKETLVKGSCRPEMTNLIT